RRAAVDLAGRRAVAQVVHAARVLQHVALDTHAALAVTRAALHQQVRGPAAGEVRLACFEGRAIAQAEQEVPFEQTEAPADRLGPARRVREHARLAIGTSQLEPGA